MASVQHRRSTTERGYGTPHQQERRRLKPIVDAGRAVCWRCGRSIAPGAPWDLGHDDNDRNVYRGPECQRCNRAAGGRRGNRIMRLRRRRVQQATTKLTW